MTEINLTPRRLFTLRLIAEWPQSSTDICKAAKWEFSKVVCEWEWADAHIRYLRNHGLIEQDGDRRDGWRRPVYRATEAGKSALAEADGHTEKNTGTG